MRGGGTDPAAVVAAPGADRTARTARTGRVPGAGERAAVAVQQDPVAEPEALGVRSGGSGPGRGGQLARGGRGGGQRGRRAEESGRGLLAPLPFQPGGEVLVGQGEGVGVREGGGDGHPIGRRRASGTGESGSGGRRRGTFRGHAHASVGRWGPVSSIDGSLVRFAGPVPRKRHGPERKFQLRATSLHSGESAQARCRTGRESASLPAPPRDRPRGRRPLRPAPRRRSGPPPPRPPCRRSPRPARCGTPRPPAPAPPPRSAPRTPRTPGR